MASVGEIPPPPHGSIVRGQGGRQPPSRCAGPSLRAIQIDRRPGRAEASAMRWERGNPYCGMESVFIGVIARAHVGPVPLSDGSPLATVGIQPMKNHRLNHSLRIRQISGAVIFKGLKKRRVEAVRPLEGLGFIGWFWWPIGFWSWHEDSLMNHGGISKHVTASVRKFIVLRLTLTITNVPYNHLTWPCPYSNPLRPRPPPQTRWHCLRTKPQHYWESRSPTSIVCTRPVGLGHSPCAWGGRFDGPGKS
jgi:hypothetical protein